MVIKNVRKYLFVFIFLFASIVFFLHLYYTKTALYSDTRFYFAYTRSIVKDHDIDLKNDFELLGVKPAVNKIGLSINTYPPGASLAWVPAYAIAEIFYFFYNLTFHLSRSVGNEIFYQIAVGLENILLATIGLYFVYQTLRRYFAEKSTLIATFVLFLGTNLFFYMAIEPITSHAVSFFSTALFVYFFVNHKRQKNYYFLLGLMGGFTALTRTQNMLILLLPVIDFFRDYKKKFYNHIAKVVQLVLGAILSFLPQIILWKLFFNIYFTGPGWGYGFNFLKPEIIYVLFNSQNGLLAITPIILFSLLGFYFFKKEKSFRTMALFYFLLQLFLISSWKEYFQGGSYSIRMIINTYPLLALGLGAFIDKFLKKFGKIKTFLFLSFFFLLNFYQIIHYLLKY